MLLHSSMPGHTMQDSSFFVCLFFYDRRTTINYQIILSKVCIYIKKLHDKFTSVQIPAVNVSRVNIPAHRFSSVTPPCVLKGRGISDCHPVYQQHGSSRKVTLKSSCGHSMIPTTRAYAGLCHLLQILSAVVELVVCFHIWASVCEFHNTAI